MKMFVCIRKFWKIWGPHFTCEFLVKNEKVDPHVCFAPDGFQIPFLYYSVHSIVALLGRMVGWSDG